MWEDIFRPKIVLIMSSNKFEKFAELWHRTSNISNFSSWPKGRTKRTRTPQKSRTSNSNSSSFHHYSRWQEENNRLLFSITGIDNQDRKLLESFKMFGTISVLLSPLWQWIDVQRKWFDKRQCCLASLHVKYLTR